MKKLSDTFCRCALATGAIIPPDGPNDPRLDWRGTLGLVLAAAVAWLIVAWVVTVVWRIA